MAMAMAMAGVARPSHVSFPTGSSSLTQRPTSACRPLHCLFSRHCPRHRHYACMMIFDPSPKRSARWWSACCVERKGEANSGEVAGFDISVLEEYTKKFPSEVLILHAVVDGEEDEVLVYKGMSSSLVRPTAVDFSEPVLPASAIVEYIDRVQSPYNHVSRKYIQKNISWGDFQKLL